MALASCHAVMWACLALRGKPLCYGPRHSYSGLDSTRPDSSRLHLMSSKGLAMLLSEPSNPTGHLLISRLYCCSRQKETLSCSSAGYTHPRPQQGGWRTLCEDSDSDSVQEKVREAVVVVSKPSMVGSAWPSRQWKVKISTLCHTHKSVGDTRRHLDYGAMND